MHFYLVEADHLERTDSNQRTDARFGFIYLLMIINKSYQIRTIEWESIRFTFIMSRRK